MPGAQTIAQYKVTQAYNEASSDKAHLEKEHYILAYSFNGKKGSRILRDATDAFGNKKYYDYALKKEMTLEQLGKVMGITDMQLGSVGKLSEIVPDAGHINASALQAPKAAPVQKTASEMAQESAPAVFDYYRMLNRISKKNVNYCADFAVNVFALVALEKGKVGCIASCNAWEMDGHLDGPRFSKTALAGLGEEEARQRLVSAPAGTIITLRSHSEFAKTLAEGLPSHAMISLGGGKYMQNVNNKISVVDMATAAIRANAQTGKVTVAGFDVVEKSGMYEPDFRAFPKAAEVEVKASDLGMIGNVAPSKFAEAISEKFGIPKTFVVSRILMQTGIQASDLGYTKSGLQVTLSLPSYMVNEYVPQFKVTPALAIFVQLKETVVQEAGFFMPGTREDKPRAGAALYDRRDKFNSQIEGLRESAVAMEIPRGDFNNLMAILYNEKYSSKRRSEIRKPMENTYVWAFGVDSPKKIKSVGDFQINIDAVCAMLSKKGEMAKFRAAISKMGLTDKELSTKLDSWDGLDRKEQRKLVNEKILSSDKQSLYFAYEFYKNSKSVLQENAIRHFGLDLPVGGAEIGAFFAHNRGIPRTKVAIFQQNLLIAAEEAGISHSGFKIDGIIQMETVELFRKVCERSGMKEVKFSEGGKSYALSIANFEKKTPAGTSTFLNIDEIIALQKLFNSSANMAMFFKDMLKSQSAKASLDPAYLRAHPDNIAQYLGNYFVFFNGKEPQVSVSKKLPKEYALGISVPRGAGQAQSINYSVPEAGVARIRIIGANGKTVLSLSRKNTAAGEYTLGLDAKKIPSGVYICEISQGTETQAKKFLVAKES